jgi:GMP synthase-like glutamine amidotransferase
MLVILRLGQGTNGIANTWRQHNRVADCFRTRARSSSFITGIASYKMNLYGVQFHPKVDLTPNGKLMLHYFYSVLLALRLVIRSATGNHSVCNISEIV